MATEQEIRALKQRHSSQLLARAGVCGVGIEKDSAGGFELAVHLDGEPDALGLPAEIEGHRVRYVRSGPFEKFGEPDHS